MKPAPFEYSAPESVDEALAPARRRRARCSRAARASCRCSTSASRGPSGSSTSTASPELAYIREGEDGTLRIGALARQAALERSQLVAERWPLLRQAVRLVGHPQIRSRGTVGGSVAHADPTAELPVALTALDARFHVARRRRAHAERRRAVQPARSRRRSPPTSCSPRSRCRRCPPGRAAPSASTPARTATSRVAGAAVVLAPATRRSRCSAPAGRRCARRPPSGRCARAPPRTRSPRSRPSSSSDEHRARARCAALVRQAVEEASA